MITSTEQEANSTQNDTVATAKQSLQKRSTIKHRKTVKYLSQAAAFIRLLPHGHCPELPNSWVSRVLIRSHSQVRSMMRSNSSTFAGSRGRWRASPKGWSQGVKWSNVANPSKKIQNHPNKSKSGTNPSQKDPKINELHPYIRNLKDLGGIKLTSKELLPSCLGSRKLRT